MYDKSNLIKKTFVTASNKQLSLYGSFSYFSGKTSATNLESIWFNVQFKDHKEINNNSHLCFPVIARSFSDLTSFNIFLQDDQNKKN